MKNDPITVKNGISQNRIHCVEWKRMCHTKPQEDFLFIKPIT
jgi:hypothetical protein